MMAATNASDQANRVQAEYGNTAGSGQLLSYCKHLAKP